jgi:hypothetical protein
VRDERKRITCSGSLPHWRSLHCQLAPLLQSQEKLGNSYSQTGTDSSSPFSCFTGSLCGTSSVIMPSWCTPIRTVQLLWLRVDRHRNGVTLLRCRNYLQCVQWEFVSFQQGEIGNERVTTAHFRPAGGRNRMSVLMYSAEGMRSFFKRLREPT